jgi:ribosomal 50S subunit-associated protein YjgA (DUF615 family)
MNEHQLTVQRLNAFARVQAIYAGEATWDDFLAQFADTDDPPIADLVRLLRLEPEPSGPSAVRDSAYRAYRAAVERAVTRLEAAAGTRG